MSWLLIIALIFFTIIAVLRLDLAVMLIIILLPTYLLRFQLLSIPSTFLETIILIGFSVWFIKATNLNFKAWFKNRIKRQPYPFHLEIILILAAAFFGATIAHFSLPALGILKAYFFEPILLFILILNILPTSKGRQKILIALMIGASLTALLAIFQQITGSFIFNPFWAQPEARRVVSWFGYPNAVGLFLGPMILIMSGWLIATWKSKPQNIFLLTSIALTIIASLLAIYFAKSEGAIIAVAVTGLICLFLINRLSRAIVVISLIILGVSIFLSAPLQNTIKEKVLLQNLSGEIRKQQWRETWQTFKGPKIILGNGLSNYQQAVKPFHQEGIFFNRDKIENFHSILYGSAELRAKYWQPVEIYLYPHNIFLNFWTELGLLGVLVFSWLIIKFLIISFRLFKNEKNFIALGLFGAMLTILIHGLVDVPYFKNDLSALFFIILALLGSLMIENKIKFKKIITNT